MSYSCNSGINISSKILKRYCVFNFLISIKNISSIQFC
nr:MAG TPA: hypothetical protein [Bacteriophage sp.]